MITSTKESVDFGRVIGKYYHEKTADIMIRLFALIAKAMHI